MNLTALRSFPCDYCSAGVGEACRTSTGKPCFEHANRIWKENDVWRAAREGASR